MNLTLALLRYNLFNQLKMIMRNFILVGVRGMFKFLKKNNYVAMSIPLSRLKL